MKKIERSELTGVFDSEGITDARRKFETMIDEQIRETGRVPVIDKCTEWIIEWNEPADTYDFTLYMYSVYVGTKKAKNEIIGYVSETEELVYA